jgi:hypothetical protein
MCTSLLKRLQIKNRFATLVGTHDCYELQVTATLVCTLVGRNDCYELQVTATLVGRNDCYELKVTGTTSTSPHTTNA